ncbi:MAG: class I SAM-dependent methyltransferase [Hydrotalea sp.]|nr:class I SAM-dependent methyltransferase [Hydrotalea sp.]
MKWWILCCLIACSTPNSQQQSESTPYTFGKASRDGIGKFFKGREIAQVMSAAGGFWLERDSREEEEGVSQAIAALMPKDRAIIVDLGAGSGYFSFRIAERYPTCSVYAVEVQDAFIQYLEKQKEAKKLERVQVWKGEVNQLPKFSQPVDMILMVDVYHELEFPFEMLQQMHKALGPNGELVLIEYRGEDPNSPIKPLHTTTVQQLNKELDTVGFELAKKLDFLPMQHFLVYRKKR